MSEQNCPVKNERFSWLAAAMLGALIALLVNVSFLPRSEDPILRSAETIGEIRRIINLKYVDTPSDEDLYYGSLRGIVSELDPHSAFVTPDELDDFMKSLRGDFGGLGIFVTMENGVLTVITPIEGTPAFKEGILAGDKILKADGESLEGLSLLEATRKLRGPVGTKVALEILHPGERKPSEVTITRAKIKIQSVKGARMVDKESNTGYLRITQFQDDTAKQFRKAIERLKSEGMEKLILDLRFNPGGLMGSAVEVAGEFLDEDVIVSTIERGKVEEPENASKGGVLLREPVVVLINKGSASAAEILAAALQDHRRAITLGARSFGKGSVQSVFRVDRGHSRLKLTTAYYYTPNGHCIHTGVACKHGGKYCFHKQNNGELKLGGLRPNVEVKMSHSEELSLRNLIHDRDIEDHKHNSEAIAGYDKKILEVDTQLRRAIQYLKEPELYKEAISRKDITKTW